MKVKESPDHGAELCPCQVAADWAAMTYAVSGLETHIYPLQGTPDLQTCNGQALVLSDLHRIEVVLDATTDFDAAAGHVAKFDGEGWAVWVLVPLQRLGEAHRAFFGMAEFVQGWWPRDDRVSFAQPEIP